jgi:hypothetical protein
MSANIVLKKVIDNRVDPSSAKFAHHDFIVGSSATVWQSFNPTSSSSSTNEFTIQVPGQNSLWSRKVMIKNSTGLSWNVLANVLLQNNTSSSITLPTGCTFYVPYRFGTDFSCQSFPFNSLVQTCNTMINGSTINCQASQVMPLIRRVFQCAPDLRKKLACPTGVTGTSIISNARGTVFDESSVFGSNENSSGCIPNGNFNCFQFYDKNGTAIFTDAASTLPSMGSGYAPGQFYGTAGVPGTAGLTLNVYAPSQNNVSGYPYSTITGSTGQNATGQSYDPNVYVNGSTVMLPIDCSGIVLPPTTNGIPVQVSVAASVPVYGSLVTMEPLLFPPFTHSDNEVSFTNVQSANVRMTMLQPSDRMCRLLRNIEAVGARSDIAPSFVGTIGTVFASAGTTNTVTGFSTIVPQIEALQYWTGQPGTNSTTSTPFNIQMYTNFLSPSLLEPIPETLVYPFLQYTPLVTTNGSLTAKSINSINATNFNSTAVNSGQLISNIITLNTCPDMLALYIVLDPTANTSVATGIAGTVAIASGTSLAANTLANATITGTVISGSKVTIGSSVYTVANATSTQISFTTAVSAYVATTVYSAITPSVSRNPTYSYSDVLACITNVSITWNNNASLLQNYLPSELLEVTASNGLPCSQAVGMGLANLPYKANVLNTNGFNLQNTANTIGALVNAQGAFNTVPTGTIGSPLLLCINKDLPTEAGTAAGVSGVYTLQVTVQTRFVDAGALPAGNPFQFFVTPIQQQYLQLIRGGTSAVVSAVAAADKMLAAEYTPLRTLQAESPFQTGMSSGHLPIHHLSGGANHAEKLWNRAHSVYAAYKAAAPVLQDIFNEGAAVGDSFAKGDNAMGTIRAMNAISNHTSGKYANDKRLQNLANEVSGGINDISAAYNSRKRAKMEGMGMHGPY